MPISPHDISNARLWTYFLLVWVTTVFAASGVSWIAAGISARDAAHDQCLSRQDARATSIRNAKGSIRFFTYQRTEATREIKSATREVREGATGASLGSAQATIRRNNDLLAHIPTIAILPRITC